MIDPYRMVFVNIAAIFFLFLGILFYVYVYPKRKINLFALLILVSLLPMLSLLRAGDYESGDFNIHIYRIMSFYDSLKEGHLFPSWAAELNATYGNPLFIFNYSLPYYAISAFHAIGFTFITGMKLYLGSTLFLSGIFMYLFVKELTNNKLAAFTGAIFYIFSPYHLIDVHFRATLGESTIFALTPLVFFFLTKYFNNKRVHFLILTGLTTGLLFLAHPLVALTILGILVLFTSYLSWIKKDKKRFFLSISSLIIGTLSSLYLWVSFLIYAPYTFPNPSNELSFSPFIQLFYSPWRYGFLFQGPYGELALIIGYTQVIVVLISGIALLTNKIPVKIRTHHIFWLSIFLLFLFLMHPFSQIIWKFFPIFWMFIPTGRLLLPIAFATSLIAGFVAITFSNTKIKRKLIYILLSLTVLSTILNWGHRRVIPEINDNVLRSNVWKSTVTEGVTAYFLNNKWADVNHFWFSELPKKHLEIIEGKGTVIQIQRTPTKHIYIVNARSPLIIKENTLYFPGWSLKSNNKQIAIYPGERGVINAKIPKGLQKLDFHYDDLPIYRFSKIISVGIFLSLLSILLFERLYLKIRKK